MKHGFFEKAKEIAIIAVMAVVVTAAAVTAMASIVIAPVAIYRMTGDAWWLATYAIYISAFAALVIFIASAGQMEGYDDFSDMNIGNEPQ